MNSYSVVMLLKMLLPSLNRRCDSQKTSGVITTGSLAGLGVAPGNITYHASKVFVNTLMHAVTYDMKQEGSKVELFNIIPSSIDTKLIR